MKWRHSIAHSRLCWENFSVYYVVVCKRVRSELSTQIKTHTHMLHITIHGGLHSRLSNVEGGGEEKSPLTFVLWIWKLQRGNPFLLRRFPSPSLSERSLSTFKEIRNGALIAERGPLILICLQTSSEERRHTQTSSPTWAAISLSFSHS